MNNILSLFNHPIINSSGQMTNTYKQIDDLLNTNLSCICLNSCTLKRNDNNLGYKLYRQYILNYYNSNNKVKPIILSIYYENMDNLKFILNDLRNIITSNILIEINIHEYGYDIQFLKDLCLELLKYYNLNSKLLIGLKLPPYLNNNFINDVSDIINLYNSVYFLVLSNTETIPNITDGNLDSDSLNNVNKQIAINNIRLFKQKLLDSIVLIGCGGITTVNDIKDYINYGASLVQLDNNFYKSDINYVNYKEINELVNKYKQIKSKI